MVSPCECRAYVNAFIIDLVRYLWKIGLGLEETLANGTVSSALCVHVLVVAMIEAHK